MDMNKIKEMLASSDTQQRNAAFRALCMEKFEARKDIFEEQVAPNIEKFRKGNHTFRLTTKDGAPLASKKIRVSQKKHDFQYGANILLLDEFSTDSENKLYRETFKQYFNMATIPFYWGDLEPIKNKPRYAANSPKIYRRPAPDLCVDYCHESGISPKLHCLFYDKFIPDWLPKNDEATMKALYEKRFCEIAERYTGKLCEFEVTNELLDEYRWGNVQSVLSHKKDSPLWAYQLARKYFPHEKLVINEGNRIPEIADMDYRSPYFMLIDGLISKGATIDKIGCQNHIFCGSKGPQNEQIFNFLQFYDPERVLKGWGYLSEFGKPLEVTEITIPTFGDDDEAEELQADILRALYRLWFSVPQMESIIYWNTVEGMAYVKPSGISTENLVRGGLFHRDLSPKKSALALKKLFDEEWHTECELVTDYGGYATLRGFYGDYVADVEGINVSFGIHKNTSDITEISINA